MGSKQPTENLRGDTYTNADTDEEQYREVVLEVHDAFSTKRLVQVRTNQAEPKMTTSAISSKSQRGAPPGWPPKNLFESVLHIPITGVSVRDHNNVILFTTQSTSFFLGFIRRKLLSDRLFVLFC